MSRRLWKTASFDKRKAADIAYSVSCDAMAVYLLNLRGMTDPDEIRTFLYVNNTLSDPFDIKDMDKAVARLKRAIEQEEKITVYGDYDADGVTATALLYLYLATVGANVDWYIPSRTLEGYGLHESAVDALAERGTSLIVTVDNGINSVKEAEYIKSKGMELIVTDHHRPGQTLPDACAVVDPHRADDTSDCKELAGVGVAFKLASALEGSSGTVLFYFAELVAIGTIADIVPLRGENRLLAILGIEAVNNSERAGIIALKSVAGLADRQLSSGNIAFSLAPRINAAGRVASAHEALELLLTDDDEEASALAQRLDGYNAGRQHDEMIIVEQAVALIDSDPNLRHARVIVADGYGWHTGIIGIVASKLVERYARPALVIARDSSGFAKGSGRSIDGFSLFEALSACSEHLTKFGGHTLAAGFTVSDENIQAFREAINAYAAKQPEFYPVLNIDFKINPATIDLALVDSISLLEPFGAENAQPVFGIFNVVIRQIKPLGAAGKHLRLIFEKRGEQYSGVYFGVSPSSFAYRVGETVDLAVVIVRNEFRGESTAAIQIRDVKLHAFSDEDYFASMSVYNSLMRGESLSESCRRLACPDRRLCMNVFSYIKSNSPCCDSPELIALRTGFTSADTAKVTVALDAFCSLGIVKYENGAYSALPRAEKVSLADSHILRRLGYSE